MFSEESLGKYTLYAKNVHTMTTNANTRRKECKQIKIAVFETKSKRMP